MKGREIALPDLVNVRDALAQVEVNVLLGVASLDLDKRRVAVGVAQAALVPHHASLDVQPHRL